MNSKKNAFISYILLLLVSSVFLTGCTPPADKGQVNENEPITETAFLMGTIAKITILDKVDRKSVV